MKKETIETFVYEMGDVLDITDVVAERSSNNAIKARTFNKVRRALVMDAKRTRTNGIVYKIVCENAKAYTLKMSELGKEKYIKHIDMLNVFDLTNAEIEESKKEEPKETKNEEPKKVDVLVRPCKYCEGYKDGYCKHKNSPFYDNKVKPDGFCFEAQQK